ncbi:MAG: hypothetical protein HKN42_13345 [Granulosicoccus sp.]|nr:hypothetical protein [Granulosicoccus sp.]
MSTPKPASPSVREDKTVKTPATVQKDHPESSRDTEREIPDGDMAEESAYPGDDYWQEKPGG